jgi:Dna[CI] antecedent, DciA
MKFDLIKQFINTFYKKHSSEIYYHKALLCWVEVVGKRIYKVSNPITIKNKILYVNVSSHMWLTELSYSKHRILEKFNSINNAAVITDIHLRLGKVPDRDEQCTTELEEKRYNLDDIKLAKNIEIEKNDVTSPQLREVLTRFKTTWEKSQIYNKLYPEAPKKYRVAQTGSPQANLLSKRIYPDYGIYSEFLSLKDKLQDFL